MIDRSRLIVLDTNVLVHVARGRAAGEWFDQAYALRARAERPLVCTVSIGEIFRIANRGPNPWGPRKRDQLMQFLAGLVRLPLTTAVLDRYGVLGAFLDARGRPIPQNDLWIAAAAAVAGAVVLTTDTDFDVLHEYGLVEREFVHPKDLPTGDRLHPPG